MLHLTYEQALTAPPVGAALFLHVGLVTLLSFLSGLWGLDLVNNPLRLLEASVRYMCSDLSSSQRLNNVFFALRITAGSLC